MMEDNVPMDGNAAIGRLRDLFAVDLSNATVTCETCDREGPLAELLFYGGSVGVVLRCPACDAVNLRFLDTGRALNLDIRGLKRVRVGRTGA
jgi:Zn finger protein HypA/HybF involved in hydrogenase expression